MRAIKAAIKKAIIIRNKNDFSSEETIIIRSLIDTNISKLI